MKRMLGLVKRTMALILPTTTEEIEKFASAIGATWYKDPETGKRVTTSTAHLKRGFCCGCDCKHCPYPAPGSRKADDAV